MYRCQRFLAAGTLLAGAMFLRQQVVAQVFRIAEMNTRQIQALNLQKTVVLIPGGILEEHGPYLPSYTDGYAIDAYTQELAKAMSRDLAGRWSCFRKFRSATTRPTRLEASGYSPEAIPFVWRRYERFTWTWPTNSENRAFAGYSSSTIMARQTTTKRSIRPRTISTMFTAAPWCICSA